MAIYEAETLVLYRGFLLEIQVKRTRDDDDGLSRNVCTTVEETLEPVQADIDQYIEDRQVRPDLEELQHGLANSLVKPVDDIALDMQIPTEVQETETPNPTRLTTELEP